MNEQSKPSPTISLIIPAHNSLATLDRCLEAVRSSDYPDYECILVDDCSDDGTAEKAETYGARVIRLVGGPFGPAYARNRGVESACGQIVFFVDSDVLIKPDTLAKVVETFETHPEASALFGSYDEKPASNEFLSQYKNLLHHYVHQIGREEASTFWSGCGAVRKNVFEKVGGFDEKRYAQPSIEDIELGYRLKAAGQRILLRKDIQVTHLKRWSLWGLIKTDIWFRAVPWTELILKYRNLPNDLNLQTSQRLSSLLLILLLVHQTIFVYHTQTLLLPMLVGLFLVIMQSWHWSDSIPALRFSPRGEKITFILIAAISLFSLLQKTHFLLLPFVFLLPALLAGTYLSNTHFRGNYILFLSTISVMLIEFFLLYSSYPLYFTIPQILIVTAIVMLNFRLYRFLAQKRGLLFAISALPLQLLYYLYSMIALVIGGSIHFMRQNTKAKQEL